MFLPLIVHYSVNSDRMLMSKRKAVFTFDQLLLLAESKITHLSNMVVWKFMHLP